MNYWNRLNSVKVSQVVASLFLSTCMFAAFLIRTNMPLAYAQEERIPGQPMYCDNTQKENKDPDNRMHNCECARAAKMCDPDDPELDKPGSMCKTYCRPDACQCHNMCTHS